ncbi:alpha/beta fold hydrolase [Geopsychrobacter electrodiphilus]|uniref:alpha/beta fold hydrolase n=1 Tax=Geopsychrobacter electrodiphilus TaxID=225196 RepID=UPI001B7F8D5E|nr:alpha/beta hydrolase [Geopsychrobacter electrodiphilus]
MRLWRGRRVADFVSTWLDLPPHLLAAPSWALPLWRDLLAWSPNAAFEELNIPIYAINGALIPESARDRCAGFVTETLMPGAGHFLQMENPTAFNQALERILDRLS